MPKLLGLGTWNFDRMVQCVEKPRGIMVNGVPVEVPRPKPKEPQAPEGFGRGTSWRIPFTMIHPRLFHTFPLFCHPGLVKRDFFQWRIDYLSLMVHCRQTKLYSKAIELVCGGTPIGCFLVDRKVHHRRKKDQHQHRTSLDQLLVQHK